MAIRQGSLVRLTHPLAGIYVPIGARGLVMGMNHRPGGEVTYRVQFPGRTIDGLTERDITPA